MIRGSIVPFCLLVLLHSTLHAEVLFGPVTVTNQELYTGTFPMHCRCTAYFLEATSQDAKETTVHLNGTRVLRQREEEWRVAAVQVELREDGPNEIEIRVGQVTGRGGATVRVYERDVTPQPMVAREYVKDSPTTERYSESFVLNHWATRFHLVVENGDPGGSNRVTSGMVAVNDQQVVTPDELHGGVGEVDEEVELRSEPEPTNEVRVTLEGPPGSKIRIGIEEPAQTVTVTQVWEKDLPWSDFLDGAIRIESGEPVVTLSFNGQAVRITGDGSEQRLGEEDNIGVFISPTGRYTGVRRAMPGMGIVRTEVLDGEWNVVGQTDAYLFGELISDDGATIASLEGGGMAEEGEEPCDLSTAELYDQSFSLVGDPIPIDYGDVLFTRYHLSYDGSCLLALCGEGQRVNMHARDGSLLWSRPWGFNEFMPVAGGRAVLASPDTLFMVGPGGEIERTVTGPSVNPEGMGFVPRLTSEIVGVQGGGFRVRVARWHGPQSCWEFEPSDIGIGWTWTSSDGRWLLAGGFIGNAGLPAYVRLVGAGGEVLWSGVVNHVLDPWVSTAITAGGEYFLLHSMHSGDSHGVPRLYRVTVE